MNPIDYCLQAKELSLYYGKKRTINNINFDIPKQRVSAIIGPSGCGKSTLLRSINRMNDFVASFRVEGKIYFNGKNIFDKSQDVVELRKNIGMVFQKPNPFPKSIFNNIVWGPKINQMEFDGEKLVEESLQKAGLWSEVKDRLQDSALALSGGQQQRLCIARAIAMNPEIILMDEPCSALDPKSTAKIEQLIFELRENYSIVIVTHNMQQAARVSDQTMFFLNGDLVEMGATKELFSNPKNTETEDYINGRFG